MYLVILPGSQLFKQVLFPELDNQSVECDKMRLIKCAPGNFALFNLSRKFNSDEFEQKCNYSTVFSFHYQLQFCG